MTMVRIGIVGLLFFVQFYEIKSEICSAGTRKVSDGTCIDCGPGTFSSSIDSSSCSLCPEGKYQDSSGALECKGCGVQTYQPFMGATSCLRCLGPRYQKFGGASSCDSCSSIGWTVFEDKSPEIAVFGGLQLGSNPCKVCPSGFTICPCEWNNNQTEYEKCYATQCEKPRSSIGDYFPCIPIPVESGFSDGNGYRKNFTEPGIQQYIRMNGTSSTDRVIQNCTQCVLGESFYIRNCSRFMDASCGVCKTYSPLRTFIQTAKGECTLYSDAVLSDCNVTRGDLLPSGVCNPCLPGTEVVEVSLSSPRCVKCPIGKYGLGGHHKCADCENGYNSTSGSSRCSAVQACSGYPNAFSPTGYAADCRSTETPLTRVISKWDNGISIMVSACEMQGEGGFLVVSNYNGVGGVMYKMVDFSSGILDNGGGGSTIGGFPYGTGDGLYYQEDGEGPSIRFGKILSVISVTAARQQNHLYVSSDYKPLLSVLGSRAKSGKIRALVYDNVTERLTSYIFKFKLTVDNVYAADHVYPYDFKTPYGLAVSYSDETIFLWIADAGIKCIFKVELPLSLSVADFQTEFHAVAWLGVFEDSASSEGDALPFQTTKLYGPSKVLVVGDTNNLLVLDSYAVWLYPDAHISRNRTLYYVCGLSKYKDRQSIDVSAMQTGLCNAFRMGGVEEFAFVDMTTTTEVSASSLTRVTTRVYILFGSLESSHVFYFDNSYITDPSYSMEHAQIAGLTVWTRLILSTSSTSVSNFLLNDHILTGFVRPHFAATHARLMTMVSRKDNTRTYEYGLGVSVREIGRSNGLCDEGMYFDGIVRACLQTPIGTFARSWSVFPTPCATGLVSLGPGKATSISGCATCGRADYSVENNNYGITLNCMEKCGSGRIFNVTSLSCSRSCNSSGGYFFDSREGICKLCPLGTMALSNDDVFSQEFVEFSYICQKCGIDTYGVSPGICLPCPNGTIAPFPGSTQCVLITANPSGMVVDNNITNRGSWNVISSISASSRGTLFVSDGYQVQKSIFNHGTIISWQTLASVFLNGYSYNFNALLTVKYIPDTEETLLYSLNGILSPANIASSGLPPMFHLIEVSNDESMLYFTGYGSTCIFRVPIFNEDLEGTGLSSWWYTSGADDRRKILTRATDPWVGNCHQINDVSEVNGDRTMSGKLGIIRDMVLMEKDTYTGVLFVSTESMSGMVDGCSSSMSIRSISLYDGTISTFLSGNKVLLPTVYSVEGLCSSVPYKISISRGTDVIYYSLSSVIKRYRIHSSGTRNNMTTSSSTVRNEEVSVFDHIVIGSYPQSMCVNARGTMTVHWSSAPQKLYSLESNAVPSVFSLNSMVSRTTAKQLVCVGHQVWFVSQQPNQTYESLQSMYVAPDPPSSLLCRGGYKLHELVGSSSSSYVCAQVGLGSFSTVGDTDNGNNVVKTCPKGTFGLIAGSDSVSYCKQCPIGSTSTLDAASGCNWCPVSSGFTVAGRECTDICPVGFYRKYMGGGETCEQCPLGYTSDENSIGFDSCIACKANTYSNESTGYRCLVCPSGYTSPEGGFECVKICGAKTCALNGKDCQDLVNGYEVITSVVLQNSVSCVLAAPSGYGVFYSDGNILGYFYDDCPSFISKDEAANDCRIREIDLLPPIVTADLKRSITSMTMETSFTNISSLYSYMVRYLYVATYLPTCSIYKIPILYKDGYVDEQATSKYLSDNQDGPNHLRRWLFVGAEACSGSPKDGTLTAAKFMSISDIQLTSDGMYLYATDIQSNTVRLVNMKTGLVKTILGNYKFRTWRTGSMPSPLGDSAGTSQDLLGYALANLPSGIGVDDSSGTVYLTMRLLNQVGRFNMVDVLSGSRLTTTFESYCGYNGIDSMRFRENASVVIDGSSCDPSSSVSCYLFRPFDVVVYDSNVIVSVQEGLVSIDTKTLRCSNVGGKIWDNTQYAAGYYDGDESESQFSSPLRLSVAADRGILYIADRLNKAIRRIFISGKCKCPQGSLYLSDARTCYDPTPSSGSKTSVDCAFGYFSLETETFCRPCEDAFGLKLNVATCIMWKKTRKPGTAVGYSFSRIQADPFPVLERMADWYGGPSRKVHVPWNDIFARDSSVLYSLGSVNGHAPYGLDFASMTFVPGVACNQRQQENDGCWMLETRPAFTPQIILPGMWYPCNDNEESMRVVSSTNEYTCSCPWNLAEFGSPQEIACKTPTWNCLRLAAIENQARSLGSNDDLPLKLQEYMNGGQAWNEKSQRVESWSRFVILGTDESARHVICKDLEYGRGPCFPFFKHIRQQTAIDLMTLPPSGDFSDIPLVSNHKWQDEQGITNLKCGVGWPSHYYCPDGYMWVAPNTTSIDRTNVSSTIYAARGSNSLGAAPVITCLSCLRGTFSVLPLNVKVVKGGPYRCELCGGGTYSSSVGASTCRRCPDNTYSASLTGSSTCIQCPVNYYSVAGSWSIEACTPCKPGTGSCLNCSAGYFQNEAAQNHCVPCRKGTYTALKSQPVCIPCEKNTYQPSTGQQGCFPCETGTFASLRGQSSCMSCSVNSLSNCSLTVNQTCGQGCGINFYWDIDSQSCVRCGSGLLNAFSKCAKSSTICQDAQDGSKFILSNREAEMGGDILGECPSGSGSQSSGFIKCEYCTIGKFSDIEQNTLGCKPCPPGSFSNSTNSTFCYECTPGTVTTAEGKVSCDRCGAGEYMGEHGGSVCMNCAAGSFSVGTGQTVCILCSNGTYGSDVGRVSDCVGLCDGSTGYYSGRGATACTYCDTGSVTLQNCVGCGKGMYAHLSTSAGDQQECRLCPNGTYNDWTDQGVNATPTCRECPVLHYSHSSRIRCVSVNAGYVPDISRTSYVACPRGTFRRENDTSCIACPPGSFQPKPGMTECTLCSPGSAQSKSGQQTCVACSSSAKLVALEQGNVQCYTCPEGQRYYSTSACITCGANTYVSPGRGECFKCPDGKVSKPGSADIWNCTRCDPYLVLEDGMCVQCTPGKYSVGREYTVFHTGETYTAYSCVACPVGTQNPYFGSTSTADCKACDIVGYVPASNQSMCVPCLPGQTADPSSYVCRNCEVGKFSPTGVVCIPCAAGFFTSFNSSVACQPCGPGTYSDVSGASSCSLCRPGTYSNKNDTHVSGTVACSVCTSSLGYTDKFGATQCTPRKTHCNVGEYLILQVEDPTLDHACASCKLCSESQLTVAASVMQNSMDPVIDMMNSDNASFIGGFMELYCPGNEIRPRYRCENNEPTAGKKLVFDYGNIGTGGSSSGSSGLSITTTLCNDINKTSMRLVDYVTGFDARYCYVGCKYGYNEAGIAAYRELYGISNGKFEDTTRNIFSPRMLSFSTDICIQCPTSSCPLGRYRPLFDASMSCGPPCFLNSFVRGCKDAPNGCIGLCTSPPNNASIIDGSSVLGNAECPWQCNDQFFLNNENTGCMSCESQISCPDGFAPVPTSECRPRHKLMDLCKQCNHVDGGVAYAYDMRYQSCVYHCNQGTHYAAGDNTNCFPCSSNMSCPYGEYLDVESCQRYGVAPVCKSCFVHNDTIGKISFLSNGGTNVTGCQAICGVGYNTYYRFGIGAPVLLSARPFTSEIRCVPCEPFTTACRGRCSPGYFRNLSVADGYNGSCVACKKSSECGTGQYAPVCLGNETADTSCRPCNVSLLYNKQQEIVKVFVPYTYRFIDELVDGMKCPTMCKMNMVLYDGTCIHCSTYVNDVLKCKEETKSAIYYAVGQPKPCDFIYSHWNATDDVIWWNDPAYTPSFMKTYLSNSRFLIDPVKKIYRRVGPVCWACPMGTATSEQRQDQNLCQVMPGYGQTASSGVVSETVSISIPSSAIQIHLSNREPRRRLIMSSSSSSGGGGTNSRRLLLDLTRGQKEFVSAAVAVTGASSSSLESVQPVIRDMFMACPIGTYNDKGTECKRCPNGTSTKYTRSLSISSCLCLPGYRRINNISTATTTTTTTFEHMSCIPCGPNMYKPLDDLLDTKCYPCSAYETTFDKINSTRCACLPGYYRRNASSGNCEQCPRNHACVSCYEGEIRSCPDEGIHRLECFSMSVSNPRSTSIENCSCANGTVKLRRRLVQESAVMLSNGGGYTLDYEKILKNNYYCMAVPPNSEYNAVTKTLSCKRGWREVWGKALVPGDVDVLRSCYLCNPGEYADVDPSIPSPVLVNGLVSYPTMKCLKCPKGSYSDSSVVIGSCIPCPQNTTTDKEGSKMKNQCGCEPPQVLASDNQTCVGCRGHEYRSSNATCIPCPSNSLASAGASKKEDCVCIAGYTLTANNGGGCVPCSKGTYSTIASNFNCTLCPTGSSTLGVASTSVADCNVCSPGYCLNAVGQRYVCVKIGLLANVKAGSDGTCIRVS